MDSASLLILIAIFLLLLVVAAPFAVSGVRRWQHRSRQRLVNARRQVRLAEEQRPGAPGCSHKPSRSRAKRGPRRTLVSVCKWCGAPMQRRGPRDWIPIDDAQPTGGD